MFQVTTKRGVVIGVALTTALLVAVKPDVLAAAWHEFAELIDLRGDPVSASPPTISEHEREELASLDAQDQAERLLERAINHYGGAIELIAERVDRWRGHFEMSRALNERFMTALNSNDLRVRAAAIEIYLAAYAVDKTPGTIDLIMKRIDADPGVHPYDLWTLGLLGNRGIEPERVLDYVVKFVDATDLETRHWAVEGLAMLGTDGTIAPLLHAFHDDPSGVIRERAACSLAQSGMLTAQQRWTAIPELIRFTDDPKLDAQTQRWAFQALQDISGQRIDNDPAAWRTWWDRTPQPPAQRRPAVAIARSTR